jgi:hypothetical protein
MLGGKPRVLLFAVKNIQRGEQLRYDYGGKDLPWRKVAMTFLHRYWSSCVFWNKSALMLLFEN